MTGPIYNTHFDVRKILLFCHEISSQNVAVRKKVLELSLFTAFVFLYVLPALKRLKRRRTIVLESRKKTNGVVAPSITIVEQSPVRQGWDGSLPQMNQGLLHEMTFSKIQMVNICLNNIKMAIIMPTGQWYAPSAVINDALIMH